METQEQDTKMETQEDTKKVLALGKKRATSIVSSIRKNFKLLGELVIEMEGKLKSKEFTEFRKHLKSLGIVNSDIEAAVKVASGELNEHLFFQGVNSQRMLRLKPELQNRLLSGEELGLMTVKGIVKKNWDNMTPMERRQIIPPSGDEILEPEKQNVYINNPVNINAGYTIHFDAATFENGNILLREKHLKRGEISIKDLAESLINQNQLDTFLDEVRKYKN